MILNPYEADPVLEQLIGFVTNLQNHNNTVLSEMYEVFKTKVFENVKTTKDGFQMLDYNHFGLKKEGDPPEVSYQTLVMSLFFDGMNYSISTKKRFENWFLSLFFTVFQYDTPLISQLNHFEFLSALPLVVYEKPPEGVPSPTSNRVVDMLYYRIKPVGDLEISDIESYLYTIFGNAQMWKVARFFSQIYANSSIPTGSEYSVLDLLQTHVLRPIAELLSNSHEISSLIQHPIPNVSQKIFGVNVPGLRNIYGDIIIQAEDKPILVGVIKEFPIFGNCTNFELLLSEPSCESFLHELLTYMIILGVTRGFISDSQTTCFVEVDAHHLSKADGIMELPLKGSIMNNQSPSPSILQMFMYFVYKGDREYVDIHEKIKEIGYFNVKHNPNPNPIPPSIKIVGQHMATPLNVDSDHMSQLLKVPGSVIKEVLEEEIDDSETLVVKIFDKRFPKIRKLYREDIESLCDELYENEKRATDILSEDPKFNNIYLKHSNEMIAYDLGYGYHFTGYFILSKYIKNSPLPKDESTYKKLREQLDIIHSHNIVHTDLSERNILYDAETKTPYIIDFDHCETGIDGGDNDMLMVMFDID